MTVRLSSSRNGFTIVELLIVIVIIAILAAITVIAFNGVQRQANETTAINDLKNASIAFEMLHAETGSYPSTLPPAITTSPNVTLTLKGAGGGGVRYENMTSVQNAVLFQNTCLATITAGWGIKEDQPSNSFFTDCIVQERTQLRLNGWNGGKYITTPVTSTSLDNHVNSYTGGNIPLYIEKATIFMTKWKELFQAQGGTFPVTGFWDPWATSSNGGIMKPSLPAPVQVSGASDGNTYCMEAVTTANPDIIMHITKGESTKSGPCS